MTHRDPTFVFADVAGFAAVTQAHAIDVSRPSIARRRRGRDVRYARSL